MKRNLLLKREAQILFACTGLLVAAATCSPKSSRVEDYEPASVAYAILAEKSVDLAASLEVESWGAMLSDSVVFYFPDGDLKTCTKIIGKKALLDWVGSHIVTSGISSMSIENATYMPVNITNPRSGGAPGNQVIAYMSNKMVYGTGAVSVRMNVIIHFDGEKMIDAYYTYFDSTPIMKLVSAF